MSTAQPPAADNQERATQIIAEYMRRVDAGEAVDRDQLVGEHPQFAAELQRYFDGVALVEQLAGPTVAEQSSPSGETPDAARRETVAATQGGDSIPEKPNSPAGGLAAGKFGRYEIEKALGEGAMGTVYLARDTELHRQVALKVPKFGDGDQEMMERFYREARAAAGLRHRHICPVYDIGEIDGVRYISIGYIEGRPLSAYVSPDRPQSERNVALIVRKLALALDAAHKDGIVHRDLKPANVMVDKEGEPVIMDFGLARQMNKPESERLTQTGTIMGSPAYMSPEQVNADMEQIGPPTDVYSLGVMLYELLTGRLPYEGSVAAVIGQILVKEPEKPTALRPDLDPRLETICLKMMAKEIGERYGSMKEVAKALAEYLKSAGKGDSQRPAGPLETVASVELKEIKANSLKQRRTRAQAAAGAAATSTAAEQASGGRKTPVAAKVQQAFDGLKNLSGRTKAIASGCAALLLVLGITIIIRIGDQTVEVTSDEPNTRIDIEGEKIGISTGGSGTGDETNSAGPAGAAETSPITSSDQLDYLATGKWEPVFTSAEDAKPTDNAQASWKGGVLELVKKAGGEDSATLNTTAGPRGRNIIFRGEINCTGYATLTLRGPAGGTNVRFAIAKDGFRLLAGGREAIHDYRPPAETAGYHDVAVAIIDGHIRAYVDGRLIIKRLNWIDVAERSPAVTVLARDKTAARAHFRNLRVMVLEEGSSAGAIPPGEAHHIAAEGLLRLGHDVQVVTAAGQRVAVHAGDSLPEGRFRLVKVAGTETKAASSDYEALAGSIARCLELESMTVKSLDLPTAQALAQAPGLRELDAGSVVGGEGPGGRADVLGALNRFPRLDALRVWSGGPGGADFVLLATIDRLRLLAFTTHNLGKEPEGWNELHRLGNLRILEPIGMTDERLTALAAAQGLEKLQGVVALYLPQATLTPDGLSRLPELAKRLPGLREIHLQYPSETAPEDADFLADLRMQLGQAKLVAYAYKFVVANPGDLDRLDELDDPDQPDDRTSSALQFDGKTSHVEIPSLKFDGSHPLTVEALIDLEEWPGEEATLFWNQPDHGMRFSVKDSFWSLRVAHGAGAVGRGGLLKRTGRLHVAAVWGGPKEPQTEEEFRIYVGGRSVPLTAGGGGLLAGTQPGPILFGAAKDAAGNVQHLFKGRLHELRISKSARYSENYEPPEKHAADEQTLVLYRVNEGSGTVLKDASGNGRDGRIVGATWIDSIFDRSESIIGR